MQQRALAAAARADDRDELAVAHCEALEVEDGKRAAVLGVALADAKRFERYFSRFVAHPCPERSNLTPASSSFFSK